MMILEFLEGGSLDEWLPANGPKLHGTELLSVVHQIALGLVALGRAGIVHRDLAARNVLIDGQLSVKIADFGLSRETDEDKNYYRYQTGRPLPIRWTAPEVLTDRAWTTLSDMYSFGVLIFEIFSWVSSACGSCPAPSPRLHRCSPRAQASPPCAKGRGGSPLATIRS